MPEGVDATSFEFYEGIRIFIPGAILVGLTDGIVRTLSASGDGLGLGTFPALVASLIAGLGFYFIDAPAKSAVFSPLLPTQHLRSWNLKPTPGTTVTNNYFVMLDALVPSGIKARALYMGSMFRIGFETVYLLTIASAAMISIGIWSSDDLSLSARNVPLEGWAAAVFTVGVYLFALRRDRAAKKRRQARANATDTDTTSSNSHDEAVVAIMVTFLGAIAVATLSDGRVPRALLAVPLTALLLLWAVRYFKGYKVPEDDDERRPISAGHACLLLGVSNLAIIMTLAVDPLAKSSLSLTELRVWLPIQALALVMVCARGHERRLRGAYATQNTWLTLNRDDVVKTYFAAAEEHDETPISQPKTDG